MVATSIPNASASTASRREGAVTVGGISARASATVHSAGGSGQASPAAPKAAASTRRSNAALWATSTRPVSRSASWGSTISGLGAPSMSAWVIPVKRWTPRPSGRLVATSEDQL